MMGVLLFLLTVILLNPYFNCNASQTWIYSPLSCTATIYYPQSSNLNKIYFKQASGMWGLNEDVRYYIFYTDLSLVQRNSYIDPPISSSGSNFYDYEQYGTVYLDIEINKDYSVWMMTHYPGTCTTDVQGEIGNCPYSETNRTCGIVNSSPQPTPNPTSPTNPPVPSPTYPTSNPSKSPSKAPYPAPTPSPVPVPTNYPTQSPTEVPSPAPTYNPITASTTDSTREWYYSSGITYQDGYIQCGLDYCYIYCNTADYACQGLYIDASKSTSVTIYCQTYLGVCRDMIISDPPTQYFYIYCTSDQSCYNIDATLTNLGGGAYIDCDGEAGSGYGGCFSSNWICNGSYIVDVDCLNYRSCNGADFYLEGVSNFDLSADGDGAAQNVDIWAETISLSANLIINCNVEGSCGGLNVFAPYAGGADVELTCKVDGACKFNTYIFIPSIVYNQIQLTCGTDTLQTSCDGLRFYCQDTFPPTYTGRFPSFSGSLGYDVTKGWSCYDTSDSGCCPINFKYGSTYTPTSGSVTFDCKSTYDCQSAIIDLRNTETATVSCTGDYSCRSVIIYGPQLSSNPTLTVECYGIEACKSAYIDSRYSTVTTINCNGESACYRQKVLYGDGDYEPNGKPSGYHYCEQGDDVCAYSQYVGKDLQYMLMSCATTTGSLTASDLDANCGGTWGDFSGSSVNILCDQQNDCYGSIWTISDLSTVNVQCDGLRSCYSIDIYGYDATSIDVECSGSYSCYFGQFQCPSTVEDACKFNCVGDYACSDINFYAEQNWILQYLDLTCDITGTLTCDDIEIYCNFDDGAPVTNVLYDINGVFCDPDNYVECCPFNTYSPTPSPTHIPTTTPSSQPTTDPTPTPTASPTDSTDSPSMTPTTPTDEPTISPTDNPTKEPTNNPTDYPTSNPTDQPTEPGDNDGDGDGDGNKCISIRYNKFLLCVLMIYALNLLF